MTVVNKKRRKNCKIKSMDLKKTHFKSFGELVGKIQLWVDVEKMAAYKELSIVINKLADY